MKSYKYIISFLLIFIISLNIFLNKLPNGNMKVSFLDIGQGDAILIQTPSMQNILVDGGPNNKILEHLGNLLPILNDQIDMIILTHPHKDHIFCLIEVVKRYKVKQILISGINFKNSFYDEFLK